MSPILGGEYLLDIFGVGWRHIDQALCHIILVSQERIQVPPCTLPNLVGTKIFASPITLKVFVGKLTDIVILFVVH
jgi:hypothetical protein